MALQLQSDPLPLARDADGVIRVGGTRVSLDSVVVTYQAGASIRELAEAFPDLSLPDIHASIAYCLRHPQEIGQYLEARRSAARVVEESLRRDFSEAYRRPTQEEGPTPEHEAER